MPIKPRLSAKLSPSTLKRKLHLRNLTRRQLSLLLVSCAVFASLGVLIIQLSRAATSSVQLEAEAATLSGASSKTTDATASGSAAVHFGAIQQPGGSLPETWKVMLLGDSITTGDAYRQKLYENLVAAGKKIDLVGSQKSSNTSMSDPDHEGHSGWRNGQMADSAQQFVSAQMPDLVVVHMGTNDIWGQLPAQTALSGLREVVDAIYAGNPETRIVLSQIILMDVGVDQLWQTYNDGVPQIVTDYKAQGKKIHLADLSATLTSGDLGDGVHPTDEGYVKMGNAYAPVVLQAMTN